MPIITAIILVQRDFGNRADRSQARMKYLIHKLGLPGFKDKVEQYLPQAEAICGLPEGVLPRPLPEPHPADGTAHDDHMGWYAQGDGKWFMGLPIENGRVKDEGNYRLKTALRKLFTDHVTNARLTAQQNIIFCDLEADSRDAIEQLLADHGVDTVDTLRPVSSFNP